MLTCELWSLCLDLPEFGLWAGVSPSDSMRLPPSQRDGMAAPSDSVFDGPLPGPGRSARSHRFRTRACATGERQNTPVRLSLCQVAGRQERVQPLCGATRGGRGLSAVRARRVPRRRHLLLVAGWIRTGAAAAAGRERARDHQHGRCVCRRARCGARRMSGNSS